jgi:uridine kinase
MKNSRSKPFVLGISGGSGSGKSTIINEIVERLGPEKIAVPHQDAYYLHRPELSI